MLAYSFAPSIKAEVLTFPFCYLQAAVVFLRFTQAINLSFLFLFVCFQFLALLLQTEALIS